MSRLWISLGVCFSLWFADPLVVANAQNVNPSEAIPDLASAVVRWKSPQASLGKLADFVDSVQPGFGAFINASLPAVGQAIQIPGLKGVDVDQDIWLIIFAEPQARPTAVVMLTAKNVEEVKDSLPDQIEVHSAGKLVLYSEDADALGEVRKRLSGEGKSLWSKVDPSSKKLFDEADVSVLVNIKQLVEDFTDELNDAEPKLDAFLDQISNAMPDPQRTQLEPVLGIYRQLAKSVLLGLHDTNSLSFGFTFSKTAIRYEDRLQFIEATSTAKFLSNQSAGNLSLLGKLPSNKSVYVGMKADLGSFVEYAMGLSKQMLVNATAEQIEQFDKASKEMGQIKFEEIAAYYDVSDTSPALRMGGVSVVTPIDRLRDLSRSMAKIIGEMKTAGFTQKTTLEQNVERIGSDDVDRMTITQEFDESLDPTGAQKKMQSLMFGEAGIQQLIMYQPKRQLQTMGGGMSELKDLATALNSTKSTNGAFVATRQRLFEKANVVVLLDLARMVSNGLKLAAQQNAIPVNVEALNSLTLDPTFVGYALVCEPSAIRSQIEIPVGQVQNIAKVINLARPR